MTFLGHATTHSEHPLQRSVLTTIAPLILLIFIIFKVFVRSCIIHTRPKNLIIFSLLLYLRNTLMSAIAIIIRFHTVSKQASPDEDVQRLLTPEQPDNQGLYMSLQ